MKEFDKLNELFYEWQASERGATTQKG
jgi:hypothetical protein